MGDHEYSTLMIALNTWMLFNKVTHWFSPIKWTHVNSDSKLHDYAVYKDYTGVGAGRKTSLLIYVCCNSLPDIK